MSRVATSSERMSRVSYRSVEEPATEAADAVCTTCRTQIMDFLCITHTADGNRIFHSTREIIIEQTAVWGTRLRY